MIIIGIDPAYSKPHAITEIEDGLILGFFKSSNLAEIMQSIERADKVFIEDQYMGMNPSTTIKLGHATGMLMGLCELVEVPYEMIYPTIWMSYFYIPTRRPNNITPYQWRKKHYKDIIAEAQKHTDLKIEDEDYAASVLISLYGANV